MLSTTKYLTQGEWEFYPLGLAYFCCCFETAFLSWCEHSPAWRVKCIWDDPFVLRSQLIWYQQWDHTSLHREMFPKCSSQEATPVKVYVVLLARMWPTDLCQPPVNKHVWWRLFLWQEGDEEVSLNSNFTKDVSRLCVSLLSMSVNKIRSLHLLFLEGI